MKFKVFCSILIENSNQEVLLVQEKSAGCYERWNIPGGHLENGEKLLDCARREVQEEVGLIIEPTNLLGVYTLVKTEIHGIFFVFYGKLHRQDQIPVANPEEILRWQWRNFDSIAQMRDTDILNPNKFRKIIVDWQCHRYHDLAILHEFY